MFNIGGGELIVILLVALIILGPERLPTVARQMGQWASELRRISGGFQDELKSAIDVPDDVKADLRAVLDTPRQIRDGLTQTITGAGPTEPRSANQPKPTADAEPIVRPGEYQAAQQPTLRAGDDIEEAAAEAAAAGRLHNDAEEPRNAAPAATPEPPLSPNPPEPAPDDESGTAQAS